jgi:hypothetical protein
MLDPDQTTRAVPSHGPAPGAGGGLDNPHALQILTTEHWSLLSSRSLGYTEAMSRASIFVAALTGSVVALALVGQATDFKDAFVAFALVLLPVVFFLGAVTIVRLGQINFEDALWIQGMNRIRHAYHELAPELDAYFVTSRHDDDRGVLTTIGMPNVVSRYQSFVAIPGVVAVLDAVVAGAIAGIAMIGLDVGTTATIALGIVVFVVTLLGFAAWGVRSITRYRAGLVVRFPSSDDV